MLIMAARFHSPHPSRRPRRATRPGAPTLTLVPAGLAAVLPMPRPAARPAGLVLLSCPVCDLDTDPVPPALAEHAAGVHDDREHGGRPTAELHTLHILSRALPVPVDGGPGFPGPDLGGAA